VALRHRLRRYFVSVLTLNMPNANGPNFNMSTRQGAEFQYTESQWAEFQHVDPSRCQTDKMSTLIQNAESHRAVLFRVRDQKQQQRKSSVTKYLK
jgi:hypothetical protein